jgi:hypothetical protein
MTPRLSVRRSRVNRVTLVRFGARNEADGDVNVEVLCEGRPRNDVEPSVEMNFPSKNEGDLRANRRFFAVDDVHSSVDVVFRLKNRRN